MLACPVDSDGNDLIAAADARVTVEAKAVIAAEQAVVDDPSDPSLRTTLADSRDRFRAAAARLDQARQAGDVATLEGRVDELEKTVALIPTGYVGEALARDLADARADLEKAKGELHVDAATASTQQAEVLRGLRPTDRFDGSEYALFQDESVDLARPLIERFFAADTIASTPQSLPDEQAARDYVAE